MEDSRISEIFEYLKSKSWKTNDQVDFTLETQIEGPTIIINGQQQKGDPVIKILTLHYEGEGAIDETPIYGFTLNEENTTYVYDLEDFKNTYNI